MTGTLDRKRHLCIYGYFYHAVNCLRYTASGIGMISEKRIQRDMWGLDLRYCTFLTFVWKSSEKPQRTSIKWLSLSRDLNPELTDYFILKNTQVIIHKVIRKRAQPKKSDRAGNETYSSTISTKYRSFCMKTFSASLTNFRVPLPRSHDKGAVCPGRDHEGPEGE